MSHEIEKIQFDGDEIWAIRNGGGRAYIIVRRVCENLGVDPDTQLRVLKSCHWADLGHMTVVADDCKDREMVVLPLDQFPMWMVTINVRKVALEIRPKLKRYQREASKVLAAHFGPQLEPRDYLGKILALYISPGLCAWSKTFPDEFYYYLCRLREWEWDPYTHKTPVQAALDTIDIVYNRLAPGVREELQRTTPRDENGKLIVKLHQKLTVDWGRLKLQIHISNVICLMKSCDTWGEFQRRLSRALPKHSEYMDQYLRLEEQS